MSPKAKKRRAPQEKIVARAVAVQRARELSPWLDEFEAAAYLKRSVKTLRNWRVTGKGPEYYQVGGPGNAVTYFRPTLDAFMRAAARSSTTVAPSEQAS